MQDDPSQYRVPILKLSDILGEDEQNGTDEGTDTAVTGMSWHTVEQSTERGSVAQPKPVLSTQGTSVAPAPPREFVAHEMVQPLTTPVQPKAPPSTQQSNVMQTQSERETYPSPSMLPDVPQPPLHTSAPVTAPPPKKHVVIPIQDIDGDALDEPTPHPLGELATASIRATIATQEYTEETHLPAPSSEQTTAVQTPEPELPNFQLASTPEIPTVSTRPPAQRAKPAKAIDPLDIWDRPAPQRAPVARKAIAGTPAPAPQEATFSAPTQNYHRDEVPLGGAVAPTHESRSFTPPTPASETVHAPGTLVPHPDPSPTIPSIWDTLDSGRRVIKPSLPKVAEFLHVASTPDTNVEKSTPLVIPSPHDTHSEHVEHAPEAPPVRIPPAPRMTRVQEASAEDLSDLLSALVVDETPPTPPSPLPDATVPLPAIPLVETPPQPALPIIEVPSVPTSGNSTTQIIPPTPAPTVPQPAKHVRPIRAIALGTDVPDMWANAETKHTQSAQKVTPHTPPTSVVDLTKNPANSVPDARASNLTALRERVMKESIGRPGETIAPPNPDAMPVRTQEVAKVDLSALANVDAMLATSNAHEPSTTHAQAISDIASKLGALTGAPVGAERSVVDVPGAQLPNALGEKIVPEKPTEGGGLPLMRTFKQDVQQTVLHNKTSVVDMISSNEKKRAVGDVVIHKGKGSSWFTPTLYVLLGTSALLLIGAVAVGVMIFLPAGDDVPTATYFTPDALIVYDSTDLERDAHMQGLLRIRDDIPSQNGSAIQVALQENIVLPISGEREIVPLTTHRLLRTWEILPPDTLDRSLTDNFMFGYVSLEVKHPFLILESNYFQGAFSGMLDWERNISTDLDPLFPTDGFGGKESHTTPASAFTTATSSTTNEGIVVQSGLSAFTDLTVANIPARVLRDQNGTSILIWSMPDDHIIITTNEEVLRRLIDRMQAREF